MTLITLITLITPNTLITRITLTTLIILTLGDELVFSLVKTLAYRVLFVRA